MADFSPSLSTKTVIFYWFWISLLILSERHTHTQLSHCLATLSHLLTHTQIYEQNQSLKCFLEKFVLGQRREGRQRENEGWRRRGVTETITVIPRVAACRYALHHSSFICALAPLLCASLSVCSVASLCLSLLLCLLLRRLLTFIICFSWVRHVWVSLQRVSCSLCYQSDWLICASAVPSSIQAVQCSNCTNLAPLINQQ